MIEQNSRKRSLNEAADGILCDSVRKEQSRSGKWKANEEAYANFLINKFENGKLNDCEDGCTLRSYLARKLKCAPMRISKKFAGRGIGKV